MRTTRLWHIDLIPFLPKSQLLAQWRELNSIFKKQDKHILINYVYDDLHALTTYIQVVKTEMNLRGYKIKSVNNYNSFMQDKEYLLFLKGGKRFAEHDDEYLTICYWNLREKYLRGQKDFSAEIWNKIEKFYKERMEK